MKILIHLGLSLMIMVGSTLADKVRVSLMFVHYSVGNQIVSSSIDGQELCHIIDTMTVAYLTDTADIVFRDYHLNYWSTGPLSDTTAGCEYFRFPGFGYDLRSPSYDRTKIWNSWDGVGNQHAGFIEDFFHVPDKENQRFWEMFLTHLVPGRSGDQITEHYDMVMIKNPYICWSFMSPAQSDSIQKFYSIVRDSIAAHPEIGVGLVFGTPRRLDDGLTDSSQAKITYNLVKWFSSDEFFTHNNSGPYKNLWKFDSYSGFLEMSPDSANRYCMKDAYSVGPGNSHLSLEGGVVGLIDLLAFIRRATQDILVIKSGSGGNTAPVVSNIPDQIIAAGSTFTAVSLDAYVSDADNSDAEMSWTYSGNLELIVTIDQNRVATVTTPSSIWSGSESIIFTATDPGFLAAQDSASFTVIANQIIVTRTDIDKKIIQFQNNQATEQEVLDLIKQYNEGNK